MELTLYQVDAFAQELFTGNPAAVICTEQELPAPLMQAIAAENNLAETAFVCGPAADRAIRWFTPTVEVDLCGHATLAAAHVLFTEYGESGDTLSFSSRSGTLGVSRAQGCLWLDFPCDPVQRDAAALDAVAAALGSRPQAVYRGRSDLMAVLSGEQQVIGLRPDLQRVAELPCRGLIVTSAGDDTDFVSRFFAPQSGVAEDPVTGSAHTTLTPYWAGVLGRSELSARQLSRRTGNLRCRDRGERVHIGGSAVTYLKGGIRV